MTSCVICNTEYDRPRKSKRRTCSKSCAVALSWQTPGVKEARTDGIIATKSTPEGRKRNNNGNKARWADPKQHLLLSKQNVERWRDPNYNERVGDAIAAAWDGDKRLAFGEKTRNRLRERKC
jgi:hypothetical protein